MRVTVYTQQGCAPCAATLRMLTHLGIASEVRDVREDLDAADLVFSMGHRETPVVYVHETGESWTGFRPDRLRALS